MAAPKSKESVYRNALVDYLELHTGINWRYYNDSQTITDPPFGGLLILSLIPMDRRMSGLASVYTMTYQLRILVTGINEDLVQDELLDYTRQVDNLLSIVSVEGIEAIYNDKPIKKVLMGIKLSEKGIVYVIERSADRDNRSDVRVSGIAFLEYEYKIEV